MTNGSQTKDRLLRQHQTNELLQAPILVPMPHNERDLSADHPTRPLDPQMVMTAYEALLQGQTHYADVPGIMPLRQAVAAYLAQQGLIEYTEANVLVTAGMQEARFLTIQIVGALFGQIALPETAHPGVRLAAGVRRIEIETLPVDPAQGYLPTLGGIAAAVERGQKLLYIESPVRLTGAVFDAAAVDEIARMVTGHDVAVLWDQGMAPWAVDRYHVSLGSRPGMAGRAVMLGEVCPGVGLESMPIAYLAAPPDWWEPMRSQKQIMSICTSTPSQYAALKAVELYSTQHGEDLAKLTAVRREAAEAASLAGLRPVPGVTANVLALAGAGPELLDRLAAAGYQVAYGSAFCAPNVVRLSMTYQGTAVAALRSLLPAA